MTTEDKSRTRAREVFERHLSTVGGRRTAERSAILDSVMGMGSHFVADDIFTALEKQGFRVSLTTIYTTLQLLEDCEILRRHSFRGGAARYERAPGYATSHHHLVCTRCGKVREVKSAELDGALQGLRTGAFRPEYAEVTVYGLCSRCRRSGKQ